VSVAPEQHRPDPAPAAKAPAGGRSVRLRLGDFRPRPLPAARTVLVSLAILLTGTALTGTALSGADPTAGPAGGPVVAWWQLAPVFVLASAFVFHVEINSEAYTFSVSEVPLILALFFAEPGDLITARLLGEVAILVLYERQALPKLFFNLSVFFAESTLALTVFHAMAGGSDPLDPRAWLAAWAAVAAASVLSTSAVWVVIRLHGGRADAGRLLLAAGVTTTCNASLAAVAAVLMISDRPALIPLILIATVVIAAYRGYNRLTKRYDGLQLLYQFTTITSGAHRPAETLQNVLAEAGRLLRAERALIVLYSPGDAEPWLVVDHPAPAGGAPARATIPALLREQVMAHGAPLTIPSTTKNPAQQQLLAELGAEDCLAAPLITGGEVTGMILVADRLGRVSTFDGEDTRLFATLAAQAAIALENGRLIERLHEQVQAREHEALHDALTGLPNRALLGTSLDTALHGGGRVGILLMDLDGFKEINDTLGHQTGDRVLCEVAQRLSGTVGTQGLVARLGGDEFAVVLPHLTDTDQARDLAHQVKDAIRQPIDLSTLTLEVGVSIGVAGYPEHGDDPTTLLQRADIAMYSAKRERAGVAVYDPSIDGNSERRLRIAVELRAALHARQLEVHYQPVARAVDGHVVGVEALARWRHPELGTISPDEFIPVAEHTRLIHELTRYVLDRALAQVHAWNAAGLDLGVAVNLSVHVLRDADWPAKVTRLLAKHSVPAHQLSFEITESATLADPDHVIRMLNQVAATGVTFAIDDFGTGYSSLAYLQRLPATKLKIDKSFVIPMATDPGAATIVRSVIDMARNLDLAVVAEGVEDQRTLDHLTSINCHYVQGYYISRPIPGSELTAWLTRYRRTARIPIRVLPVQPRSSETARPS
jgi:diguanylate cyclase (GGDEF)-like protein